jgi:hypothetical protein
MNKIGFYSHGIYHQGGNVVILRNEEEAEFSDEELLSPVKTPILTVKSLLPPRSSCFFSA